MAHSIWFHYLWLVVSIVWNAYLCSFAALFCVHFKAAPSPSRNSHKNVLSVWNGKLMLLIDLNASHPYSHHYTVFFGRNPFSITTREVRSTETDSQCWTVVSLCIFLSFCSPSIAGVSKNQKQNTRLCFRTTMISLQKELWSWKENWSCLI